MDRVCSALLLVALGLHAACTSERSARTRGGAQPEAPASTKPPNSAKKSASGLLSEVLKPGSGDKRPAAHDRVRVHFTTWNGKGEVVDGTLLRDGPATFELSGVIPGFREALQDMRVGERRRLWIPDRLVYPGRPGFPRPTAMFDLQLLEILEGEAPPSAPADVAATPADATKTPSGVAYKFLKQSGSQEKPRAWDRVTVHYAGWSSAGALIERSHERPSTFDVAQLMPGLREALLLLSIGDRARVWIPAPLADRERAGQPKGDVVFEVELVAVTQLPEPPRAPKELAAAPAEAKRTRSGLAYRILRQGQGKIRPKLQDRVQVHYSAWTSAGALFDSSVLRGKPVTVPVHRLIPGWAEGLQLMTEGEKAQFWIPENLAYEGREGSPRGMLVYEVELLKVAL